MKNIKFLSLSLCFIIVATKTKNYMISRFWSSCLIQSTVFRASAASIWSPDDFFRHLCLRSHVRPSDALIKTLQKPYKTAPALGLSTSYEGEAWNHNIPALL